MSLPEGLAQIAERVVRFHDDGGDAPFQLYIYDPTDEWAVRRELQDLRIWLEAAPRRVSCAAISLGELFWQALDEGGWLPELFEQEKATLDDPGGLREMNQGVAEALRDSPSLPERVLAKLDALADGRDSDRVAVFLYRAGALYPAYRTSTLLDDLLGQVRQPVTLLYPGTMVGEGLRFMGVCEPTYGYRALKIPRGGRQ